MRIGYNPNKDVKIEQSEYCHQVLIPVHIPNFEGYFKESFQIFQLCLESLFATCHKKTFISVVNNGSHREVVSYLDDLYAQGKIHEIIHTCGIGKANSILKGLVGHNFPLVTISDSDVLFCSGWQQETVKIFNAFPKAGMVGITPQFKTFELGCGNILVEKFFSKNLKFTKVKDPEALKKFYESIGWDTNYNQDYLKYNLSIQHKNAEALLGSGHFVATYKKAIFETVIQHANFKLGGDALKYFDVLPLKKGLWRLMTTANYAFHMGNTLEDWMHDEIKKTSNVNSEEVLFYTENKKIKNISSVAYFLKSRLPVRLFSIPIVKRTFYKLKGLPKEMIARY